MRRFFTGTNYCGPGGDGEIIGSVDEACARHDRSYNKSYYRDYFRSQRADKVFLRDLEKSTPLGFRQRFTKGFARRYFGLKTRFWDSFDNMLPSNNKGSGVILGADGQARFVASKRKPRRSPFRRQVKPNAAMHMVPMIAPPGYKSYSSKPYYYRRVGLAAKKLYIGRRFFKKRSYLRNGFRRVRS